MSKPLTKGVTIGFRIDLDLDAQLRDEADRHEMSPGTYVADIITDRLRRARQIAVAPPRDVIHRTSQDRREAEE